MAGLSKQQIADLEALDRSDFDSREWVALAWTRAFFTGNGKVDAALGEKLEAVFSPKERRLIQSAVKGMFISNLTSNTVRLGLARLRTFLDRT